MHGHFHEAICASLHTLTNLKSIVYIVSIDRASEARAAGAGGVTDPHGDSNERTNEMGSFVYVRGLGYEYAAPGAMRPTAPEHE